MTRRSIIKPLIAGLMIFLTTSMLHATTQPKFTIIPTTPTTITMASTDTATVQYNVTNKTKITRTLTMVPIEGISPITTGPGYCANPFTLAQNQSCLLTLQLNGSQLPRRVSGGPVICKTNGPGDNSPDPFLCSQPALADSLNITRFERARLLPNPRKLILNAGFETGQIIVTNLSSVVTATNVHAVINSSSALNGNVSYTAGDDCVSVAPGGTCTLTFTSGINTVSTTPFLIIGDNTFPTVAAIQIVSPTSADISVSPNPLIMYLGGPSVNLTVTNNSAILTANDVTANLTGVDITQSPLAGCAPILPGQTCTLSFSPGSTLYPSPGVTVSIQGSDTSLTTVQMIVNDTPATTIAITSPTTPPTPPLLELPADGTTTGTMTVQNTGPATAVSVTAFPPALYVSVTSSSCQTAASSCSLTYPYACNIATGDSCTFVFTPGTTILPATQFQITGSNTGSGATGQISVGSYYLYIASRGTGGVNRCNVNVTDGSMYNCGFLSTPASNSQGVVIYTAPSGISYLYTTNGINNTITGCIIDTGNGNLTNCSNYGGLVSPTGITLNPILPILYVAQNDGGIFNLAVGQCSINTSNGALSCGSSGSGTLLYANGVDVNPAGTLLYVTTGSSGGFDSVLKCPLNGQGNVSTCTTAGGTLLNYPFNILTNSTYAFITNAQGTVGNPEVIRCTFSSGSLTACSNTGVSIGNPLGLTVSSILPYAYISSNSANPPLYRCAYDGTSISACVAEGSATAPVGIALWETPLT